MDCQGSSHSLYLLCLSICSHVKSSASVLVGWMHYELYSIVVQWGEGANGVLNVRCILKEVVHANLSVLLLVSP